jgi:signal recognition particle subunit SRP72
MTATSDLTSLLRNIQITSDEDILRAANTILKTSKNDATARHARIVAFLKLDRFDDALRAFEESGDALKENAELEYAYALYKAGELQKAEEVAQKHGSGDGKRARGARHVLAQTTYRLEKFDEAKQLYEQLSQPSTDAQNEESDLRINGAAVEAQLEWKGLGHLVGKRRPSREDLESFEGTYNEACKSIARGEVGQAEILLKRAKGKYFVLPDRMSEQSSR